MADYILQEDGVSKILLEDGSGALLLEQQTTVAVPFISSVTAVYTPQLNQVSPGFIASATTVYALTVQHGPTTSGYSETFTVSSTWVCPPSITSILVECWGGGGGGGYSSGPDASGAGGGGAYAANSAVPVTPGTTYTVTVGPGGAAGNSGATDGTDGSDSSFTGDSATLVTAKGGKARSATSVGGNGGAAASSTGVTKFSGGKGGDGQTGGGGGGGGAAGSALGTGAAGSNGTGSGGPGGSGAGGAGSGGNGGNGGNAGVGGTAPGGGGGGDGQGASLTAGAGAPGQVRISWPTIPVGAIPSVTVVYAPTVVAASATVTVPFIASATSVHAPTLVAPYVFVPFIASKTRVFGIFSLFDPDLTFVGPGNGGEIFPVRLAPNGTSETATLAVDLAAAGTLLELTGDSGLPSTEPFVLTIDDEQIYVVQIAAGLYRIRRRGSGNTTPGAHTAGADVTWGDSYDLAIRAGADIASTFDADIDGSGLTTYPGWLFVFDATQAYLAGDRYPMHVTEFVGVFDAGAGVTGTNRCDASQPNAIASAEAASDDCPAALSNLSRIDSDIAAGDVAVLRYTNPEASALDLGPRSVALQSWFGIKRVDAGGADVTFTDPNGIAVDTKDGEGTFTGSVNGEWLNPLGPAIGPSTGTPTPNDAPYTSVTLDGDDRQFTRTTEKGWPIGVLAVRHGNRRVPFWQSWDWHDFSYVYCGFGPDCSFAQVVINRNGIIFGSVPEVDLPGTQDIDGPDAVWDDGSYYFGVSWYVAIFNTPYLVIGPAIGGTTGSGTDIGFMPVLQGGGGGFGPPVIAVPGLPPVEGGSGGGIEPPTARKQLVQVAHV